jgi:uncharacterized membrane protein
MANNNKKVKPTFPLLLFFFVASTFIVLIIVFLWKEKIDFSQKINDQKVSNFFVTVFTTLGAIATIYYAAKQYKLQHATSVEPEVVPFGTLKFKLSERLSYFLAKENAELPQLSIQNFGPGVARNIKIKWEYDSQEFFKPVQVRIESMDDFKNMPRIIFYQYEFSGFYIHHLAPDKIKKIELPIGYFSRFLFKEGQTKASSKNLPKLSISIEYQDIN